MKKHIGITVFCVWFVFSCKDNNAKHSNETKIVFNQDGFELYNINLGKDLNKEFYLKKSRKIFSIINVSCATCIGDLRALNKLVMSVDTSKIAILPVCFSKDRFEALRYLFESNQLKDIVVPLILDTAQIFRFENKNFIDKEGFYKMAFLLDSSNNLIGKGKIEKGTLDTKFLRTIEHVY